MILTYVTTFWEVPLEPPGEKTEIKGKNSGKKQTKHVLEVLLRFSVGYILEMDSDRGRSVWQSGEY